MQNLRTIKLLKEEIEDSNIYPFSIPAIKSLAELEIKNRVVFFIGENGSGKSTLLEAIADNFGFGKEGGSKNISFKTSDEPLENNLSGSLRLAWSKKLPRGYFLRTESFFNVASFLEELEKDPRNGDVYGPYGGKSLHKQSHGESFLSLFKNRFTQSNGNFFLLDEPEAALSPKRQLSFLVLIQQILNDFPETQFIIATHSPILLSFPGAQIFSFDNQKISQVEYKDTDLFVVTKRFLQDPDSFLQKLLG